MSENLNEKSLRKFLSEISEGAIFTGFQYRSQREFLIEIKSKVPLHKDSNYYNNYTKSWIEHFTKFTSTAWIVRANFPNLKRLVYRKIYVCHRSGFNKKYPESRRNKECKARIEFKVRLTTLNTLRTDKLLREGYNMQINIKFLHTHPIWDSTSLHLLRTASAVDEVFIKYMMEGMAPVVAKTYHNIALAAEYSRDAPEMSCATFNPIVRHIMYLYGKLKASKTCIMEPDEVIIKKKEELESDGYNIHFEDNNYIIITPLMKRIALNFLTDKVVIDTTNVNSNFISILYIPSIIGALPIASVIHSSNTENNLQHLFNITKTLIEQTHHNIIQPKVVMCQGVDMLFGIKTVCPRHVLISEVWSHLNEFSHSDSLHIMTLISSMINTVNTDDAEAIFIELKQKCDSPLLLEYITRIWMQKEFNLNGNFDITIRLIKQFLISRCECFNNIILIDIITRVLETYWRKIIQAHCTNKDIEMVYLSLLNNENKSKSKVDKEFLSKTWCCNCTGGKQGEFCPHLYNNLNDILKVDIPQDEMAKYLEVIGHDTCNPFRLKYNEMMIKTSEDEDMIPVQEADMEDDNSDPLNSPISTNIVYEIPVTNNSTESYRSRLRMLHAEFIRLSRMFKENQNATNMDVMFKLARELSKIRPEKLNVINLEAIVYNDEKIERED